MSNEGDWVFDPFLGTGTSIIAAIRHNRHGAGAEVVQDYIDIACDRIRQQINGTLKTRPMNRPVYDPEENGNSLTIPPWNNQKTTQQISLFEEDKKRYEKVH